MASEFEIKQYKRKQLPSPSQSRPNSIYWIKADIDTEIKGYITDQNGVPFSLRDIFSGGVNTVTNNDGTITVSGTTSVIVRISSSVMAVVNSALQTGDNISNLINDVGYLVVTDLSNTKTEFNTQLIDGDFLFVGDIFQYTNEQAQDAVGTILIDTQTIDFNYNDVANQITASVKPDSITSAELANNINISEFINNEGFIDHTDLSKTQNPTNVIIHSDTGTDATINLADGLNAGVTENNFTDTEKTNLANQSGVNTGDQTLIVGITGTKSEFNTALTDGDFLFDGDAVENITSIGNTIIVTPVVDDINLEVIQATESQLGGGQITTQAIIEDENTTDDLKLVTSKKFWQGWSKGLTLTSFFNAVRNTILTGFNSSITWARVTTSSTIQNAISLLQQQSNYLQATRFISGAGVSINADPTKFDIQVVGEIVDPITFVPTVINVNLTAQSTTYIGTQVESYVWINSSGVVIQSLTPPLPTDYDSIIGYWVLIHSNLTTINIINTFPFYADGVAIKLAQLLSFIGFAKFPNTNIATAGTTGTRLQHTGGFAIKLGLGNTSKRPVADLLGFVDPANMEMRHRNLTFSTGVQNIDVINYNPSGSTVSALSNNKFSIHKIWKFSSSLIRVQYGQKQYDSYNEAVSGMTADSYIDEGNAFRNGLHIGWLIFKKGTSWGTGGTGVDGVDYKFVDVKSNGSTGGLTPTLQAGYDVSGQPQTTTSISKGAIQDKRGTALDTDAVREILNGAGTVTISLKGDGAIYMHNTTTPSTPVLGGILYVESGALKYIGSSGTITTLGVA